MSLTPTMVVISLLAVIRVSRFNIITAASPTATTSHPGSRCTRGADLVGELTNLEMLRPYWKRGHELKNTGTILCCVSKGLSDRLMRWGNNGANRGGPGRSEGREGSGGSQHGTAAKAWSQCRTPRRPLGHSRRRSPLFDSGSRGRQRAARCGQGCFP